MNDDTIQDLKQFITATVSQEIIELRSDINGLDSRVSGLDTKISNLDVTMSTRFDDLSKSVA